MVSSTLPLYLSLNKDACLTIGLNISFNQVMSLSEGQGLELKHIWRWTGPKRVKSLSENGKTALGTTDGTLGMGSQRRAGMLMADRIRYGTGGPYQCCRGSLTECFKNDITTWKLVYEPVTLLKSFPAIRITGRSKPARGEGEDVLDTSA